MRRVFLSCLWIVCCIVTWGCQAHSAVNGQGRCPVRPTVIVDPGHGGVDGGAVGISGVVEKDVNLTISMRFGQLLTFLGYEVVMTREDDRSIHSEDAKTIRQMKASDLCNRLAISKQYPDARYISIHQNNFDDPSQNGMCFYYSPNNPQSKVLAETMHQILLDTLQRDNRRKPKQAASNLFILYHTENPAVLVECGFLSNREEEQRLKDSTYQNQICILLTSALSKDCNP